MPVKNLNDYSKTTKMDEKFTIEHQYQLYLKRVALDETTMHPEQRKQLKQTFFGACGQMIIMLRDDVGSLEEDKAVEVLESMKNEVGNFFLKITGKQN